MRTPPSHVATCSDIPHLPAPRRILLLAMLPIGDTLLLTPTLRALRARHPAARLTALAYATNAPLLRNVPWVDEVLELPRFDPVRACAEYARLLAELRHEDYGVAVDFTSPLFKWIAIGAGITWRTYMRFDPGWWWLPGSHETWRATHAARLYYDCARALDLPPWETQDHRPWVSVPDTAREEAAALLTQGGVASDSTQPLVALHPGGKGLRGQKRWNPDHFVTVAHALSARWGARPIILGGRDEQDLAAVVAARLSPAPVTAAGRLSLMGTVALLARCALFIGNDSSLLHLAACQGTPYVGLFGPTCLANFQPIPRSPRQGRLAIAWPPPQHVGYFVGARPIWSAGVAPRDARAALATISPELVLTYSDDLLAERLEPLTPDTSHLHSRAEHA